MGGGAYDWDETKRVRNLAKHGVDFNALGAFDWATALHVVHDRAGERRIKSLGLIGARLHVLVWTARGEIVRVISLRKANSREVEGYEARRP